MPEPQHEPVWLQGLRRGADALIREAVKPAESDEEWRHTDPSAIPFDLAQASEEEPDIEAARSVADRLGVRTGLVVSGSGAPVVIESRAGIQIDRLDSDGAEAGDLVPADRDLPSALNAGAFKAGVHVRVPPATREVEPLVLVHVAPRSGGLWAPRTLVEVGTSAEISVVEVYVSGANDEGAEPAETLAVPVTETRVDDGATLGQVYVQSVHESTWFVGAHVARLGRDCTYRSVVVNLGARLGRLRHEVHLAGEGTDVEMYGVYVGDRGRHVDFRTRQAHHAPRCRSRLLYKGAVWGGSSAIYSGLIQIDEAAAKSDAHQAGHYLILSGDARAAVIPNLEIHNHDVSCGHAASGGPPDEDQMYYLEARGIDEEAARRLVVDGFFSDVIDRIPLQGVRAYVEADVFRRLGDRISGAGSGRRMVS